MATTVAAPIVLEASPAARRRGLRFGASLSGVLTVLAVAVSGYHPFAEDGGMYIAGVKWALDPKLYPHETAFVADYLRFSVFAPLVAGIVRASHLRLETALLLLYAASFWVTLYAAWLLASRCFASRTARCGAVSLLAVWMTLPIAGTSLMLMDPYFTARSLSTPCSLLAVVGALMFLQPETEAERVRGIALACGSLAAAVAMHPLMGTYAVGYVLVAGCVTSARRTALISSAAVLAAGVLWKLAPPESALYRRAAVTRDYWFLGRWQWYEIVGLVAPLLILAAVGFGKRRKGDAAKVTLARVSVVCGATATVVALLFARMGTASYLVARLQPLRVLQLAYVVMILVLGAELAERVLKRRTERWVGVFVLLGGVMVFAGWQTFPASDHIEMPPTLRRGAVQNQWQQAFVWIRQNTPKDALFAMDAHYITKPGEDAQGFRALAERSALPDYAKDGGEAANYPQLVPAWTAGTRAETRLEQETDAQRLAALGPLGVTWVVLDSKAQTGFSCGFENGAVKVCQLPRVTVASRR